MREAEGDYSGAVRVLARANKRLQALEKAELYEKNSIVLEEDVSTFQLANQYARFYIAQKNELLLKKVLAHIPNVILRVSYYKHAKLYSLAVEEYIKDKQFKRAERLIMAQELYDLGLQMAESNKDSVLRAKFILASVSSAIKNEYKNSYKEDLRKLTTHENLPIKARALLMSGITLAKATYYKEAMNLYEKQGNTVGVVEAFNLLISADKDTMASVIVKRCIGVQALADSLTTKSASTAQTVQHALDFYQLTKLEDSYVMCYHDDIVVGSLHKCMMKESRHDEDGMLILDPTKVKDTLAFRYKEFLTTWLEIAELDKKLINLFNSFSFHLDLTKKLHISGYLTGYPAHRLSDYIQTVNIALEAKQLDQQVLSQLNVEHIPIQLFSPGVFLSLPLGKFHRIAMGNCSQIEPTVRAIASKYLSRRSLKCANVDQLLLAWRAHCIVSNVRDMESTIDAFIAKENIIGSETWVIADSKMKEYRYFFSPWLKACYLVHSPQNALGAMKAVYYFLTLVGRSSVLRPTLSVMNWAHIATLYTVSLLGLISVGQGSSTKILVPSFFKHHAQVFDALNAQGSNACWLMSACVQQIEKVKKNDSNLDRIIDDSLKWLVRMLHLLLGRFNAHNHLLTIALREKNLVPKDHSLLHLLVLLLILTANLCVLLPDGDTTASDAILEIQSQLRNANNTVQPSKLPPYFSSVCSKLDEAKTVGNLFDLSANLLLHGKYPHAIARMLPAKSGNMDFKEIMKKDVPSGLLGTLIKQEIKEKVVPAEEAPEAVPSYNFPNSFHQEQFMFIQQCKLESQQYQASLMEKIHEIQSCPQHLLTPEMRRQLAILSQQYFQNQDAYQKYILQEMKILQEAGINPTRVAPPTVAEQPPQAQEDQGKEEDEVDEELEQLLATKSSTVTISDNDNDGGVDEGGDSNNSLIADEVVDQKYCSVCGVSFVTDNDIMLEEDEEAATTSKVISYHDHVQSEEHNHNFLAFKQFNTVKAEQYDQLRGHVDTMMKKANQLQEIATVNALVLQIKQELQEADQRLEDCQSHHNWRSAYSMMNDSLDVMRGWVTHLEKICVQEVTFMPEKEEEQEEVEDQDFKFEEEVINVDFDKQRSRNKKRQHRNRRQH